MIALFQVAAQIAASRGSNQNCATANTRARRGQSCARRLSLAHVRNNKAYEQRLTSVFVVQSGAHRVDDGGCRMRWRKKAPLQQRRGRRRCGRRRRGNDVGDGGGTSEELKKPISVAPPLFARLGRRAASERSVDVEADACRIFCRHAGGRQFERARAYACGRVFSTCASVCTRMHVDARARRIVARFFKHTKRRSFATRTQLSHATTAERANDCKPKSRS